MDPHASNPPMHLIALAATNYPLNHKRNTITTMFLALFLVALLLSPSKIVLAVEHAATHLLLDLQRAHEARVRGISVFVVHAIKMLGRFCVLAVRLSFLLAFVLLEQAAPKGWLGVKPVGLDSPNEILLEKRNSKTDFTAANKFNYDAIPSAPRPSSSKSCPVSTKGRPSLSARIPTRSFSTSGLPAPKSIIGRPKVAKRLSSKSVVFDFSIAGTKPLASRPKSSDKTTLKTKGASNKTIVAAEITPEIATFKPNAKDETDVVVEETPEVKEQVPIKEEVSDMPEDIINIVEVTPEIQEQVSDVADTIPKVEDIPAVQEENVMVGALQTDEQYFNDMNHIQQFGETDSIDEMIGVMEMPIRPEEEYEGETVPNSYAPFEVSTPELSSDSSSLVTPTTAMELDSYWADHHYNPANPVSQSTPVGPRRSMVDQVKMVAKKLMTSKSSSSIPSGGRARKFPAPEFMTPVSRSDISFTLNDEKQRKRMSWASGKLNRADSTKSTTSRNSNADLVSIAESTDRMSEDSAIGNVPQLIKSEHRKKVSRGGSLFKKIVGKDKVDVEGGEKREKKEKRGKRL